MLEVWNEERNCGYPPESLLAFDPQAVEHLWINSSTVNITVQFIVTFKDLLHRSLTRRFLVNSSGFNGWACGLLRWQWGINSLDCTIPAYLLTIRVGRSARALRSPLCIRKQFFIENDWTLILMLYFSSYGRSKNWVQPWCWTWILLVGKQLRIIHGFDSYSEPNPSITAGVTSLIIEVFLDLTSRCWMLEPCSC